MDEFFFELLHRVMFAVLSLSLLIGFFSIGRTIAMYESDDYMTTGRLPAWIYIGGLVIFIAIFFGVLYILLYR